MPSKLIRSLRNQPLLQGGVLTIGHFDGIHLGHQALITKVIGAAKKKQVPSIVMTFEPHAFEFFNKETLKTPRLSRLREKWEALSKAGIDYLVVLTFNQALATLSAQDFITEILYKPFHPNEIIIGDDFHFGHKRQGDFALLKSMGNALGFQVSAMPTFVLDDTRISSSRVRSALAQDDLVLAKALLGHPYYMLGRVRHGDQLGRQWGFPTINIDLHRALSPVHGIYTVLVYGLGDKPLPGAANVGIRPTIGGTKILLEVHLLNFNQDVYGRYVKVEFCKKLRDEIRFASIEDLKKQIHLDVIAAKHFFNIE